MKFEVRLYREATRALDRLDQPTKRRVLERIEALALDPHDRRLGKALTNAEGLRSARVGGLRVLYTVDDANRVILVLAIRPRGQAYRRL